MNYYAMEAETFEGLRQINKQLFGAGEILTADRRRDLANTMHVLLLRVTPITGRMQCRNTMETNRGGETK